MEGSRKVQRMAAGPEHSEFLYQVYASARREEVAAWGWEPDHQEDFLRMQFGLQQRAYALQYPGAETVLILFQEQPVGRAVILRTSAEFRLVDIVVLPAYRNRALGGSLIRQLQEEAAAAGLPLRLAVLKGSPARRLYERLGFVQTGEDQTRCAMEWIA